MKKRKDVIAAVTTATNEFQLSNNQSIVGMPENSPVKRESRKFAIRKFNGRLDETRQEAISSHTNQLQNDLETVFKLKDALTEEELDQWQTSTENWDTYFSKRYG